MSRYPNNSGDLMKTTITAIVSSLLAAGLVFFLMNARIRQSSDAANLEMLFFAEEAVQKQINELSTRIDRQLSSLCNVVSAHKEFSLKILVENDRSSPVITEMASNFLKPMGFSVLEITDSAYAILSSGHFPANAGNRSTEKAQFLSSETAACLENIMGVETLTMQAKKSFRIAGFPFYVMGGVTLDSTLLNRLTPRKNVILLLKKGKDFIGMKDIKSISKITDNTIIINDKKYLAAECPLVSVGLEDEISILVLIDET
jgi:hypothetical protein